jgi:hypothetical protein
VTSKQISFQPPLQEEQSQSPTDEHAGVAPPIMSTSRNIQTMDMLCHLAAPAGSTGILSGNILGPLLVWLLKGEDSSFIDAHGKEAVNFQIAVTIYVIISGVLILADIGIILLPAVLIFSAIAIIVATVKTNNGVAYLYPLSLRFIK